MKNFVILLITLWTGTGFSQTMKWVPFSQGSVSGKCTCNTSSKNDYMCYTLEYTPEASGTLTSYTTGFLVSCTSLGSTIVVKNESCGMTSNTNIINGCNELGKILINSSGNSGTAGSTTVEKGKPITLHQICFNVPVGETITIEEEELTDLTTSIDIGNGDAKTEFPVFVPYTITRPIYDAAKPTKWLDFQTSPLGDLIAQLDWTVGNYNGVDHFSVERSLDGVNFTPIGTVKLDRELSVENSFQFIDRNAIAGLNYYQIKIFNRFGQSEDSPVRIVNFASGDFQVTATPNPASTYIQVDIKGMGEVGEVFLTDIKGDRVVFDKVQGTNTATRLDVSSIASGMYTLQVKSGDLIHTEKVVILER